MGRFPVQSWVGIGTNVRPARPVGGVNGTGTRGSRMFGGKGDGGRTGDRVGAFGHVGVVTSERRADMLGRRTGQDMVPVAALPPSSSTAASTASTASRPRLSRTSSLSWRVSTMRGTCGGTWMWIYTCWALRQRRGRRQRRKSCAVCRAGIGASCCFWILTWRAGRRGTI